MTLSCNLCGGPHLFDTTVPSELWNAVIRSAGLPDYLCLTCIVAAFAKVGVSFRATLWSDEFNGLPVTFIINGGGEDVCQLSGDGGCNGNI
jgi:hypothetical protein